ncbi:MAG: sigma factor-like helix-turn-helix DNA-binding protein [Steroidobacteraceae bacterium]
MNLEQRYACFPGPAWRLRGEPQADLRSLWVQCLSAAATSRTFMRLPVSQRSAVILRDVLGYSVEEVSEVMSGSVPVIKGMLQGVP